MKDLAETDPALSAIPAGGSPQATAHPDATMLAAFGLGRLTDAESAPIEDHVAECEACRAQLEQALSDPFVARVRAVGGRSHHAAPTRPGRMDFGYELLEVIGRGGMGVVYRARQLGLNRVVALKMLRDGYACRNDDLRRLRAEAEAAARLQHPHIVQIHEVGERDSQPFLALEFVAGGTLQERLAAGPLPPQTAAELVETLARAVDFAHRHGVLHRDLKPSNVLLATDEPGSKPGEHDALRTPKISDFGLAKILDAPDGPTRTGTILGTPSYMAPEQIGGGQDGAVGPAADVYSLGAILYECITGRPPFRAATSLETLEQVRRDEPVAPTAIQPRTPRDLETICLKCLRKQPQSRYAAAGELADDLARFRGGEPILARPAGTAERLMKWCRRRPGPAAAIGAGAAATLLLVIGGWIYNARLRAEITRADANAAEAARQQSRAAEHYRQARDALRTVLNRGDATLRPPDATITDVRLHQLEDALAFYRAAMAAGDADAEMRHDAAMAHLAAARELTIQSRLDRVEPHLRDAQKTLTDLVVECPAVVAYQESLGHCYNTLGYWHTNRGQLAEAERFHQQALAIRERLAEMQVDAPLRWRPLAESYLNLGSLHESNGRLDQAAEHFRRAAELWSRALRDKPDDYARLNLADCRINLAAVTSAAGRASEAAAHYPEIERLLTPLCSSASEGVRAKSSLAAAYVNWGNLLRFAGQFEAALERFAKAESLVDDALRQEPTWLNARQTRYLVHGARAQAYESAGRWSEALADWDRAVAAALDSSQRTRVRLLRVLARARSGDHADAVAEADALCQQAGLSGSDYYNLACAVGVSIAAARTDSALDPQARARFEDESVERALGHLEAARRAGFFRAPESIELLNTDADLAALRAHPKFRGFVQSLNSTGK